MTLHAYNEKILEATEVQDIEEEVVSTEEYMSNLMVKTVEFREYVVDANINRSLSANYHAITDQSCSELSCGQSQESTDFGNVEIGAIIDRPVIRLKFSNPTVPK